MGDVAKPTMSFGSWLIEQLRIRELTQSDFARKMRIQPVVISQWVNGKRVPNWNSCFAIADSLDLPANQVLKAAGKSHDSSVDVDNDTEDRLVAIFRKLSPKSQTEVLDFVEFKRGRELQALRAASIDKANVT